MAQNQLETDHPHVGEEFHKFQEERDELNRAIEAQNENRQELLRELQQLNTQQDQSNYANNVTQVQAQIQEPVQMQTRPPENVIQPEIFYRSSWKQWVAALAAASILFHPTMYCSWRAESGELRPLYETVLHIIFNILGSIVGAMMADVFGRRLTLLLCLPSVIPRLIWLIFEGSPWVWVMKVFTDFASGIICTVVPLYISEIASASNCANLLTIQLLSSASGMFSIITLLLIFVHNNDSLTAYRIISGLLLAVTVLFHGITIALFPESPQYLILKQKYEEAAKSVSFYTGMANLRIQQPLIGQPANSYSTNSRQGCHSKLRDLVKTENLRGIAIILPLIVIKWLRGLQRYDSMLQRWAVVNIGSWHGLIVSSALNTIFAILVLISIRIFLRKIPILSVISMSFVIAIIGVTPLVENYNWVQCLVILYENLVSYLLMGVTLVYTGQIFAINVRAELIAISLCFEVLFSHLFTWFEDFITTEAFVTHALRKWSALNIAVYFSSFILILVFFSKNNKLPNTKINLETSTNVNYST